MIEKAKTTTGLSWPALAELLNLHSHYLSHELRNGTCTLSISTFLRLCLITGTKFDEDTLQIISSNWGQKIGGLKGGGGKPKKTEILVDKSEDLAEILGLILGDGHIDKSVKSGQYAIKICGGEDDIEYLQSCVSPLFLRVFGKRLKSFRFKKAMAVMYYINDKAIVFTLEHYGLKAGNKKENNVQIPSWIFENNNQLRACLRGLFDTDGTVFPKSSNHNSPQLELTSKIEGIQRTFRQGLLQLGYEPSKWSDSGSPKCGLYAKCQVEKYAKEIGFHNPKLEKRFESILRRNSKKMNG
ncbi:MAG: LAGLIDADG family homing endonuclease [Candidatus Bathyarchaeia archaeon]